MRLIDADAIEELFREVIGGIAKKPEMNGNLEHMVRASAMVIEMIKDAPTIEPERTGRWIDETFKPWGLVHHPYRCSLCGEHAEYDSMYCPNCGCRMMGVAHE